MPIYEFQCKKCSEVHERIQKFSDAPMKKCPTCGGKVEKLMSLGAFHLKGEGWYVTDYKGKNASTGPENGGDKGESSAKADKPKEKKDKSEKASKKAD